MNIFLTGSCSAPRDCTKETTFWRRIIFGALCAGQFGCGPQVLLDRPPDWPAQWKKRQLFNTPTAFIYAGSAGASGEVDNLALQVAREFKEKTGAQPTKGLLIVTDTGEEPIIPDTKTVYQLWAQGKSLAQGQNEVSAQAMERKWKEEEREQTEHGLSMDEMLRSMPVPLSQEQLSSILGFGPEVMKDVQWAIIMPTRAVVHENAKKLLQRALEEEGVNLAVRVLLAPFLFFAESKMTDALAMGRELLLFSQWVSDLPDLSAERKTAIIKPFLERKKENMLGSLRKAMKTEELQADE